MVPWKVAWAGDSSYKTNRKSRAEQEEKLRAMQEEMTRKVASLESKMDTRIGADHGPDSALTATPCDSPVTKTKSMSIVLFFLISS